MKKYYILVLAVFIILPACTFTSRIYVNKDSFKEKETIKLNQTLKGYSDERRRSLFGFPDYYVQFKHYFEVNQQDQETYLLDLKMSTSVRAYEIEPALYISYDGKSRVLEAEENILKMYQQGSTSTSSESSTSTTENEDGETETTSSTTYTTTDSHDTYQLMQLRFYPGVDLINELATAKHCCFRVYIDKEIIDIPLEKKEKRKFRKFVKMIS